MALQSGSKTEEKAGQLISSVNEVVTLMEEEKLKKAKVQKEVDIIEKEISDLENVLLFKKQKFEQISKEIFEKRTEMQNCEQLVEDIDAGITKLTECASNLINLMKH